MFGSDSRETQPSVFKEHDGFVFSVEETKGSGTEPMTRPSGTDPVTESVVWGFSDLKEKEDAWKQYDNLFLVSEPENVLDCPEEDGRIIGRLERYAGGELLEDLGDWLHILSGGIDGYINRSYTKEYCRFREAVPWTDISGYSGSRRELIAYAEQFIGTPYVYGGNDLKQGIDCSAYVQQCFANAIGIRLPRTSREQASSGKGVPVTLEEAKAGDLLFYADESGTVDHVAMYLGDGKILHAAQSLGQVTVSEYNYNTEPVKILNFIGK